MLKHELYVLTASILFFGLSAGAVAILLSPLQFMKVLKQETNLSYRTIFRRYQRQDKGRIFFRGWKPYALMNFLSSAAFGLSEYLAGKYFLHYSPDASMAENLIVRASLGAALETMLTINSEISEITRNKAEFLYRKAVVSELFASVFIRNFIFWSGGVYSYLLTVQSGVRGFQEGLLEFFIGVISGIISIPFDVITTKNCASEKYLSIPQRFLQSIRTQGVHSVFAGTTMRLLQIAVYTVVTARVMHFTERFLNS